jgi:hypothetical protein
MTLGSFPCLTISIVNTRWNPAGKTPKVVRTLNRFSIGSNAFPHSFFSAISLYLLLILQSNNPLYRSTTASCIYLFSQIIPLPSFGMLHTYQNLIRRVRPIIIFFELDWRARVTILKMQIFIFGYLLGTRMLCTGYYVTEQEKQTPQSF